MRPRGSAAIGTFPRSRRASNLTATRILTFIHSLYPRVPFVFPALSHTMAPTERVVYLEDLEGETKKDREDAKAALNASEDAATGATAMSKVEAKVTVNKVKQSGTTAMKRQRSLIDMFSGAPSKSGPTSKKIKVAGSSSSLQSLNSIPFSLSSYQETLTDEEKKLLALECETMGKSW